MKVKPGYKQTEVGVIPEDWEVIELGERATFKTGPFGSALHKSDYVENGVPWINPIHIIDGYLIPDSRVTITEDAANLLNDFKLRINDIVIARRGEMGRCAVVPESQAGWLCGSGSMIIRCTQRIEPDFVQRVLASPRAIADIESASVGSTMNNLNQGVLANLKIQCPPTMIEQRAIAAVLSDGDALISGLELLIAKKRAVKQAALQQLLTGKTRLPGFDGKWEVKQLGDLFEITSSKRVFQSEWKSEGVPFYRARELAVLGDKGFVKNELFISYEMYEAYKEVYGVPRVGDMLVTGVGTLGKVYVVPDERPFYFKDGNIIWFKSAGKVSADFLKQLYSTQLIIKQIADASAGTTVGTYTISGAKKTNIPLPSLTEQLAVAAVLSDIDAEIAALEQKRDKTCLLKQGMMQELLTGKTRLL